MEGVVCESGQHRPIKAIAYVAALQPLRSFHSRFR
jgi:hypothetical protein